MVGGFVGQARRHDERDVGQKPTGKPVQPADSPRNQLIDVSLGPFIARCCDLPGGRHDSGFIGRPRPVLRQRGVPTCLRGGLLGHHGGGGTFREPEMWVICRSNRAVGWS